MMILVIRVFMAGGQHSSSSTTAFVGSRRDATVSYRDYAKFPNPCLGSRVQSDRQHAPVENVTAAAEEERRLSSSSGLLI